MTKAQMVALLSAALGGSEKVTHGELVASIVGMRAAADLITEHGSNVPANAIRRAADHLEEQCR